MVQTYDPSCLLSFSLLGQTLQRGQELKGWHGELLKRRLWDQLGRKRLCGCGWGNFELLVLCFTCNRKGVLGSKGCWTHCCSSHIAVQ